MEVIIIQHYIRCFSMGSKPKIDSSKNITPGPLDYTLPSKVSDKNNNQFMLDV